MLLRGCSPALVDARRGRHTNVLNRNLSTSSLYCLRGRQTVANIVNIRMAVAEDGKLTNSMWVGFGSSHQDLLQLKRKYPNLFAAALGSSTRLQAQVNFYKSKAVFQFISSSGFSEDGQLTLSVPTRKLVFVSESVTTWCDFLEARRTISPLVTEQHVLKEAQN
ncbi:hypothetical protein MG293_004768 [Ovis ammon polii]|uniref:Uncharacterized protein n=1 Tax=Ovis ammon polii TaxID=230172 RepID=A0AAD4UDK4_OVIAM|nr:hypothetical protein MG293_004768 [Ovis ammon polii]